MILSKPQQRNSIRKLLYMFPYMLKKNNTSYPRLYGSVTLGFLKGMLGNKNKSCIQLL